MLVLPLAAVAGVLALALPLPLTTPAYALTPPLRMLAIARVGADDLTATSAVLAIDPITGRVTVLANASYPPEVGVGFAYDGKTSTIYFEGWDEEAGTNVFVVVNLHTGKSTHHPLSLSNPNVMDFAVLDGSLDDYRDDRNARGYTHTLFGLSAQPGHGELSSIVLLGLVIRLGRVVLCSRFNDAWQ